MEVLQCFGDWLPGLVAFVVGLVVVIYFYLSHRMSYWERIGVPYVKPSLIFGSLKNSIFLRTNIGLEINELYKKLSGHRFGGIFFFTRPVLMLRDPELIKTICVKDFSHFVDHDDLADEEVDPLQSKHLFALKGNRWRHMRVKLTPIFTSGKMKRMFNFVCECAEELRKLMEQEVKKGEAIEVRDLMARYTTDVIASCAFGFEANSLKNPNAEFRVMGRKITDPAGLLDGIRAVILVSFRSLAKMLKISFTTKEVENFFRTTVEDTIHYRENNNVIRNDFIDLLIKLKNEGKVEDDEDGEIHQNELLPADDAKIDLTNDDITAQVLIFFIGGFETSSTLLNFALYEMAFHPDIQERLRNEVDAFFEKYEGNVTYQAVLHEMEYLDKVVSETLRKYPPGTFTDRICTKPYTIPKTNVTLDVGTVLKIPIIGLQNDARYFPDPEKFDPERFSEENKKKRPLCTYMPFGEGPRMCIGNRFALMQSKVCLVTILSHFEIQTSDKTKIPFVFEPKGFFLSEKGGTWLKIVKRNDK